MTRIILHGCNGKMGKTITELITEYPDMEIVAGIDRTQTKLSYPVFSTLEECAVSGDVIIDFSVPSAIPALLQTAVSRQTPVVLSTTGLNDAEQSLIRQAAQKIAILQSANMSLGVNLMADLIQKAALVLQEAGFDMEIIEKHHHHKKDAPSGTALYLADSLKAVLKETPKYVTDRSSYQAPRKENEIGILSLRGGNIAGEHQVIFAGEDEIIEIHHKAGSRRIFAVGAISAAAFLKGKPAGIYHMNDVIAAKK